MTPEEQRTYWREYKRAWRAANPELDRAQRERENAARVYNFGFRTPPRGRDA